MQRITILVFILHAAHVATQDVGIAMGLASEELEMGGACPTDGASCALGLLQRQAVAGASSRHVVAHDAATTCGDDSKFVSPTGATCANIASIPASYRGVHCELLTSIGAPLAGQIAIQGSCLSTCRCCDNATFVSGGANCANIAQLPVSVRGEACEKLTEIGAPIGVQEAIQANCFQTCGACKAAQPAQPAPEQQCVDLACGEKCLYDNQCAGHEEFDANNMHPIYCCPNIKRCVDHRRQNECGGERVCNQRCSERLDRQGYPSNCAEKCPDWDFNNWVVC